MTRMPMPEELEALKKALSDALGELRVVRTERDLLKEQLNRFKRQLFDARSEVSAAHQKDLFFNEAEIEGAQAQPAAAEAEDEKVEVPAHQRTKRGRKPLDPNLPRDVRRHELPEDERVCPHDGAALREIGVEVSEQMDVIPQQMRVIRHERVKYACPCCDGGLRLAPKPPQVIPKGLLSEAALAWVITSKYLDGLPLYRQAALLGRFGGTELSRNTLAASVVRVADQRVAVEQARGAFPEERHGAAGRRHSRTSARARWMRLFAASRVMASCVATSMMLSCSMSRSRITSHCIATAHSCFIARYCLCLTMPMRNLSAVLGMKGLYTRRKSQPGSQRARSSRATRARG